MRSTPPRRGRRLATLASAAVVIAPLAYAVPAAHAAPSLDEGEQTTYIVQLKDKPIAAYDGGIRGLAATKPGTGEKVDADSNKADAYAKHLDAVRESTLGSLGVSADRLVTEYDVAFNGMAVKLTQAEAAHLKKLDTVVQVWEDEIRHADTVQTPDYLGLTGDDGVWQTHFEGPANAGEGIVVGVIDTGIDPNNPSFSAEGIAPPPADWLGNCDEAGTDRVGAFECNNKIIGARWYGAEFGNTVIPEEYASARDRNGHGSHTAGTAAGNHGVPLQIKGIPLGEASGMAPAAHISVYKGLWQTPDGTGSGTTTGLVQAIDDAVADGVDVINYSISGSSTSVVGPDEIAFLFAADAGIFVSTSAGNSGDTVGASSVAHNAPWTMTVAASTHNRGAEKDVTVGGPAVERWAGKDRYATAARIADEYVAPVSKVFIATGRDFADALAATPAAAAAAAGVGPAALGEDSASPVLLTKPDELPTVTADALAELMPTEVVILGGTGAVEQSVEDDLVAAGYDVRRISGENRFDTAAMIALERTGPVDTVFVATGVRDAFADALAGGPLASQVNAPILLTRNDTAPQETLDALATLNPANVVVLGGSGAVDEATFAELGGTERIFGSNRYGTSAAIAAEFPADVDLALVASGQNFPDALAGAAFAGSRGVPVVLTRSASLPAESAAALERLNPARVPILGGSVAVGTAVEAALTAMFPAEPAQTFSGVGNGSGTIGELVDSEDIPATGRTAADARLCLLGSVDDAAAAGKIVICTRGSNARTEKSQEVADSGGIGMILVNSTDAESLNADFHAVPSIHVNGTDGTAIKAYEAASARPFARFSDQSTAPVNAPEMAGFSSFGPALAGGGDLLKPDITAPGVDIAAAYHGDWDDPTVPTFDQISGTSMSAPHIAGLAALMKQEFPEWSPAAVKSAMMTTARDTDDNGGPIQRAGADATPLDFGAGEVQPRASYNPGLVYDAGFDEWLAYACGLGQLLAPCPTTPVDASDLNYPSIAIGDLAGTQTVTRTVTDVTGVGGTYAVEVDAPAGTAVEVSPTTLVVPPGGSASYDVTVTTTTAEPNTYTFGQLRLVNGDIVVESPIAVQPLAVSAPAEISGTGVEGSADFSVQSGFAGTIDLDVDGLIPSAVTDATVVSDGPSGGASFADLVIPVTVPADTSTLRVSLFDEEISVPGTDMDLYLANGAGQVIAQSATGGSDESITLEDVPAGAYLVAIDYWDAAAGSSATVPVHVWSVTTADAGNLTVDPTSVPVTVGGAFDVSVAWSGLTAGSRYLGSVNYLDGTEVGGRTLVSVVTAAAE